VEDLRLTPLEQVRILDACTWVGITAGFLPYLREYLAVRLADQPDLSARLARLDDRTTYYLWEWIKDEQLKPVLRVSQVKEASEVQTTGQLRPLV
jgi:hypothetical protein